MSTSTAPTRAGGAPVRAGEQQRAGLELVFGLVAVMWVVELINTLDNNALDSDGIYARNVSRLWGIFMSPFVHASFAHLISNTIPFLFLGVIIALRGASRTAAVTAIIILVGGFGTWLIGPAGVSTIGASGVVFGYAAYLLSRGVFNRNLLELLIAVVVAVVWGGALLTSLIPHYGVSWQAHACGAAAGVLAAWLLSRDRSAKAVAPGAGTPALPG